MAPSTFVDARSVFVASRPFGDSPVRYRCEGCGETVDGRSGHQHTVMDCLTVLSLRVEMLGAAASGPRR